MKNTELHTAPAYLLNLPEEKRDARVVVRVLSTDAWVIPWNRSTPQDQLATPYAEFNPDSTSKLSAGHLVCYGATTEALSTIARPRRPLRTQRDWTNYRTAVLRPAGLYGAAVPPECLTPFTPAETTEGAPVSTTPEADPSMTAEVYVGLQNDPRVLAAVDALVQQAAATTRVVAEVARELFPQFNAVPQDGPHSTSALTRVLPFVAQDVTTRAVDLGRGNALANTQEG